MGLPRIAPYAPLGPADLPANRVGWQIDPHRAALLVHDMQQHFVGAFAAPVNSGVAVGSGVDVQPQSAIGTAISNIGVLAATARSAGLPVIFTVQPPDQQPADRGLLTDFWGPGLTGQPSAQVVPELRPQPGDVVLTKWRYNAFLRTPLLDVLQQHGRDQLIIVGVYAHIGCLLTACHAFMIDIETFLVADAIADFTREDHVSALTYAAARCARVEATADLARGLVDPGAEPAAGLPATLATVGASGR